MARVQVLPAVVFLLLLLLLAVATDGGRPWETVGTTAVEGARICESRSLKFKGVCLSGTNCAVICRTEGFQSGHCGHGAPRGCVCTKPC